jgi:hypothetical protein
MRLAREQTEGQHTDGPRFEGAEVDEKTRSANEKLASDDDTALK